MTINLVGRRRFLKSAAQSAVAAPILSAFGNLNQTPPPHKSPSAPPPKPKLTLNVRDYGAAGDGRTDDTIAIQQTIDRCAVLGGGEILIPAGNYSSGALALRSNTLVRLEKDATILGSPEFSAYPTTQVRWEGRWIQGHIGLIYAVDAEHVGVVGPGSIVGNHALGGRPNAQNPLRHPCVMEFINCRNIRLEDFFHQQLFDVGTSSDLLRKYFYKNLTIRSTGGNGDGIDIDSCKHVVIDGCDIATGDDCISLKSGRGAEAFSLLRTTEDVVIRNCTFADSIFACIGIGSETSGGIRNVRIEHCKFTAARTFAIYIKSRPGRGAFIEDIICNDLDVSGMTGGFSASIS